MAVATILGAACLPTPGPPAGAGSEPSAAATPVPTTSPTAGPGEGSVAIDPRAEAAVARGRARVLVALRVADGAAPESALDSAERVAARRRAIAAAQSAVVSRLAGTDFALVRRFDSVPLMTLEIGPVALARLRAMTDLVDRVTAESVIPPAGGAGR